MTQLVASFLSSMGRYLRNLPNFSSLKITVSSTQRCSLSFSLSISLSHFNIKMIPLWFGRKSRRCFDFARIMSPYVNHRRNARVDVWRAIHTRWKKGKGIVHTANEETIRFGRRCIRCNTRSRDRQMTTTKCNEGGAGCACGLYTRNTSDEATDTEGLVRRDYLTASCPRVRRNREKTTKEKVVSRFPLHGDTAKWISHCPIKSPLLFRDTIENVLGEIAEYYLKPCC